MRGYGRQMHRQPGQPQPNQPPDQPDPIPFIGRLTAENPIYREAAAWTLGEIGDARAARPLAGLLLREMNTVDITGLIHYTDVVRASVEALRRLGATETLYALVRTLCKMSHATYVDDDAVAEVVDALNEVGGPTAVREAADRVVQDAHGTPDEDISNGLATVGRVTMARLSLCGDAGVATLRRLSARGPTTLQPIAARAYASVRSLS